MKGNPRNLALHTCQVVRGSRRGLDILERRVGALRGRDLDEVAGCCGGRLQGLGELGAGRGLAKLDLLHLLHLPVGLFSLTARHRIEFLGHVSFPGLLAVGEAGLAGRGAFVGCAGVYALEVGP